MNEDVGARLLVRAQEKIWGKYRGTVQDRDDPEQLGRLRLRVPSLLGDAVTGWAWPVAPYAGAGHGFFFVPQVGDLVWVEFAEGELDQPLWTGGSWAKPDGKLETPEEAQGSYPHQHVLRTPSGHVILLDDTSGKEKIVVRAKEGCEIVIDPGASTITVKAGTVVVQSDGGQAQELATKSFVKNVFEMHIHATAVGPTDKPTPMPPVPDALTSVLKAQ
jgi:uncharacterized protein involved in type VI secretion and phage assembly